MSDSGDNVQGEVVHLKGFPTDIALPFDPRISGVGTARDPQLRGQSSDKLIAERIVAHIPEGREKGVDDVVFLIVG